MHLAGAPSDDDGSNPVGGVVRELDLVLVELLGSLLPVSDAGVVVRRDLRVLVAGDSEFVVAVVVVGASSAFLPLVVVALGVAAALSSVAASDPFLLRRFDVVVVFALSSVVASDAVLLRRLEVVLVASSSLAASVPFLPRRFDVVVFAVSSLALFFLLDFDELVWSVAAVSASFLLLFLVFFLEVDVLFPVSSWRLVG